MFFYNILLISRKIYDTFSKKHFKKRKEKHLKNNVQKKKLFENINKVFYIFFHEFTLM